MHFRKIEMRAWTRASAVIVRGSKRRRCWERREESESFKPRCRGEVPSNELVSGQDQEEGTEERELEMPSESKSIVLCKCFASSLSSQKGRLIICTIVLLISRAWENKSDV